MKTTTRRITVTGILIALSLILGLTPVGYIPIPPIKITLMCIPVIIGTIMEGLVPGLILGLVFGVTSMIQLFMGDPMMALFNVNPFYMLLIIYIPRLLIPVFTWLVNKAVIGKSTDLRRHGVAAGLGALTGSLTNTALFLGMLYLLMGPEVGKLLGIPADAVGATLATIGATNGGPELGVAILLTVPIVLALKRIYKKRFNINKDQSEA
jgi:uncharacterized membrane protein